MPNGLRILTEHHKYSRSTSAGIFIDLGTRDEPSHLVGVAHFVEHILFKGTPSRTAYDIVRSLESVGGEINAFTGREHTCFHASTLREDRRLSMDILSDIIAHSQFTQDDFEKEREVVLHEISLSKGQLDEYIFDLYFEKAFGKHPLSRSILGTPETLAQLTPQSVTDFYKSRYCGKNLIVAAAGHVDHNQVVHDIQDRLTSQTLKNWHQRKKPSMPPFRSFTHRPSEPVHTLIGLPSSSYRDPTRFESYVVHAILGGGMTSRLYQIIREQQGLAYSVYSSLHSFTDAGLIMVYAATSTEQTGKVMDIIRDEMIRLKKEGISQKDLDLFKKQVMGHIVLGADDVDNRLNSIVVNEMIFGKHLSVDEVICEVEKVSVDSVQGFLDQYFHMDKLGVMLIGPLEKGDEVVSLF